MLESTHCADRSTVEYGVISLNSLHGKLGAIEGGREVKLYRAGSFLCNMAYKGIWGSCDGQYGGTGYRLLPLGGVLLPTHLCVPVTWVLYRVS